MPNGVFCVKTVESSSRFSISVINCFWMSSYSLYRFGLIGILALAYLVYSYCKSIQTTPRFSIKNSLILLTFLVIGLQEACMDERVLFLIIGIALTFLKDKKPEDEDKNIKKNNK